MDRRWTLSCAGGGPVTLVFEQFETEAEYDWVNLYDGADAAAPALADTLSGDFGGLARTRFVSSGGALTVDFQSDGSVGAGGFEASYACGGATAALTGPPPPPSPDACAAELSALAAPMQAACCAPPSVCANAAPPTACSEGCSAVFLLFASRCAGFLAADRPDFGGFGRLCQARARRPSSAWTVTVRG